MLAPRNRKRTAPLVSYAHSVSMRRQLGILLRVASYAKRGILQTLEGTPSAQSVLQARTKTQLGSLTALPVSLAAMQIRREGKLLVSFVGQGPTRRATVPQLDAHSVMLENLNSTQGRASVTTAILASIV